MAKTVCKILGVAFLLAGVLGFVNPMLLGFHLTPVHNVVHLATAAVALYLGFAGSLSAARVFCLAFGAVYALLGVLGFVAPGVVAAVLMHPPVSAGELTPDNLFHIVVGGVFLAAGLATSTVEARPARA
jgi:hypothetical protein